MRFVFLGFLLGISLSACANRQIDEIPLADAGQVFKTRFGTVVSQHPVTVRSSPQTAISLGIFAAGVTSTLIAADNVTFVGGALAGVRQPPLSIILAKSMMPLNIKSCWKMDPLC